MNAIELTNALFYVFAAIMILAALRVITSRNPVHAVLYLVLSFFTGAAIWILLQAEFLALILLLVYVGAVMVLFLFVVMMMDLDLTGLKNSARRNLVSATIVGVLIVLEMSAVIFRGFWMIDSHIPKSAAKIGLTAEIGKALFTEYLFNVELAAIILLVALIAAVTLTFRKRTDAKYTSAGRAIHVRSEDRLRLVEMKAETFETRVTVNEGQDVTKQTETP